jgi:2-C-methyl-D-erythritol 4-phosphate cytidylyltransferase
VAAVPETAAVIIVHDAARPLASEELFRAVIAAVTAGGAGGAVPGVPVSDTIKVVDGTRSVTATLDRAALVAVQTPQAFDAALLRRAHASGAEATDDAALVEALGATVRVVPGDARNLKITTPADLELAEHLLRG